MIGGFKIRILLLLALSGTILATGVMGRETLDEFNLGCDPDSLAYIYANYWEDYYVACTITYEGTLWPDCRMRIRGDTSRIFPKKSLKIKSDGDPFPNGTQIMNINADWEDQTYMRSVMATHVFEAAGHSCFKASHLRLYLNGVYWGLYVLVENMDEDFLAARGMDPMGNLYKATEDGATLTIYDDIHALWEKKSNEAAPWDDLQTLIDSLDTVPDAEYYDFCQRTFDYPKMINILAVNSVISNGSTYYHNYYMYHDINGSGLWTMLPWDLDKTFGQYGMYSYHRTSKASLPDNPVPERAFLVDPIFEDYKARIAEIKEIIFNPDSLFAIMDSLEIVLEASVAADETDDVANLDDWRAYIADDKWVGIEFYGPWIQHQFDDWPRSFKVDRQPVSFPDSVRLNWYPSSDPNGDALEYKVRYCPDIYWAAENTVTYEGITDTTFTLPATPAPGEYFFQIKVTDGDPYALLDAYNSYGTFIVDPGTILPNVISVNTTLNEAGSPYFITDSLTVTAGAVLTLLAGTEIRLSPSADMVVLGRLQAWGSEIAPVIFRGVPGEDAWGCLAFENNPGLSTLRHVLIRDASSGGNPDWQLAALSAKQSEVLIDQGIFDGNVRCIFSEDSEMQTLGCHFLQSNTSEFINNRFGTSLIEDCIFEWVVAGDAVDFDFLADGVVRDCVFLGGIDDLIDFGDSTEGLVEGCIIHDATDKGLSVGEFSNATMRRSEISACAIGVAVKDDAHIALENVTLHGNVIALAAYEKNAGWGGGHATLVDCILSASVDQTVSVDEYSDASVTWSLSDIELLAGEGNLFDDPLFVAAGSRDFRLQAMSPCIDMGNPNSPLDPDGTRSDMGAYYFDQVMRSLVINEINYNSSVDFDPGDWVEIFNPSEQAVDMDGMVFKDDSDAHFFIFPANSLIEGGGFLVLCETLAPFQALFPAWMQPSATRASDSAEAARSCGSTIRSA